MREQDRESRLSKRIFKGEIQEEAAMRFELGQYVYISQERTETERLPGRILYIDPHESARPYLVWVRAPLSRHYWCAAGDLSPREEA